MQPAGKPAFLHLPETRIFSLLCNRWEDNGTDSQAVTDTRRFSMAEADVVK